MVVGLTLALLHPGHVCSAVRADLRSHVLHRGRVVAQQTMRTRMTASRLRLVRCRLTVRLAVRLRVLRRRQARILRGLRGTSEFGLQLRKLILETFVLRCQLLLLGAKSGVLRAQLFDHRHGDGERGLTLEANCNRCRELAHTPNLHMTCSRKPNQDTRLRRPQLGLQSRTLSAGAEQFPFLLTPVPQLLFWPSGGLLFRRKRLGA